MSYVAVNGVDILSSGKRYFVVKAAGDIESPEHSAEAMKLGEAQAGVGLFVATGRSYGTIGHAAEVAARLSKETPGNRYYVVAMVLGFRTDSHIRPY